MSSGSLSERERQGLREALTQAGEALFEGAVVLSRSDERTPHADEAREAHDAVRAALQSSAVEQPREDEINTEEAGMEQPMAGPSVPRDEAEISRKKAYAITRADDLLRQLLTGGNRLSAAEHEDARECRGLLAEWRQETD